MERFKGDAQLKCAHQLVSRKKEKPFLEYIDKSISLLKRYEDCSRLFFVPAFFSPPLRLPSTSASYALFSLWYIFIMKWGIKAIDWGVAMRGVVFVGGVVVLSVKWRDGAATVFNDLAFGMLAVIVGFHLGANMALRTKDSTIVEGGCRGMGQRAGVELAEMGEPTGNRVDEKVKKVVKETTKKTETQAETETETETETEILRDLFQSTPHLVGICELHESDDGLFDILAVWENRSARPENPPRSLRSSYSQSYVDKWIEVYSDSIRLKIPMSFKVGCLFRVVVFSDNVCAPLKSNRR